MKETPFPENRREFLTLAAAAAAGLGATLPVASSAVHAAEASTELAADIARWFESVPGKHHQVTDWPELNHGMGLIYTLAFLISTPAGLGVSPADVGAVLVIRHDTIPLALGDAVWAKYKLGEVFKIDDPETKAPAVRNPYYLKPGALPFQEAALSRLIGAGVRVAACDLALTFRSMMIAKKMGLEPAAVKQEWMDALHPGIKVLPSGVFACHAAQARGFTYMFAG
ncbi:MAG: twin-arginine translocation signal domain-containing protein [Betaproteobacteria bacterium]|nr:twin-arginine translocation signal domain-containing protein [Betaproteobacteria bacterium]